MTDLVLFLLLIVSLSPGAFGNTTATHVEPMADTVTVTVHVDGARSTEGRVIVALFASDEGFPRKLRKAAYSASVPLRSDSASVQIANVREGTYAVFVVHDSNSDGRLDTNWMGMPKEGIALSKWTGGRPTFDDSTIEVRADTTVDLSFYYR